MILKIDYEHMKVTFLGTGTSQGIPVITCDCLVCKSLDPKDKRLRTSVMVQLKGKTIVIDTGPDFRQQMLREKVQQLDAVLFTHEHKDHIAGLDDIRAFNFKQKKDMEVFATERVQKALKREYKYIFSGDDYPGLPQVHLNTIDTTPFHIQDLKITPIEVFHYKLPVLGFRIKDFTYITDANSISDEELEKIKGSKVIVLNALQKRDHISHFTLSQAIDLLTELKPEKAYLVHLSHYMGLHREVSRELPDFIEIAHDGLEIEL